MVGCLDNDGNFIFGTIVTVVNLKVLVSSYQYSIQSVIAVMIGILSFWGIFVWLSYASYYDMSGDVQHMFNTPDAYTLLFLMSTGFLLVDYGLVTVNNELGSWIMKQKELAAYKQRKDYLKDETVTRRKVAGYHSKSIYFLTI